MIRYILDFFLLVNLRDIAFKSRFEFMSPRTVLCLLQRLQQSRLIGGNIRRRNNDELEEILRRLWEKAAVQAQESDFEFERKKWVDVMGMCNSCLCSLIPEGTRDHHLTYLGDIRRGAPTAGIPQPR